jgi:hypothetical protein
MTLRELFLICSPLLKRDFDPLEIMKVLTYNRTIYWSWGVSKKINLDDKGLLLKVSGNLHKGWVLITLEWNDTYNVTIISNKGEIKETFTEVYFTELTEVIDNRIEKIKDYYM